MQWGRNGEGGTEDPYLMGEYAAAYTRGFQFQGKNNSKYLTAILTLKHYVANSVDNTRINRTSHTDGQTYTKGDIINRHTMDVNISNAQLQGEHNLFIRIWVQMSTNCKCIDRVFGSVPGSRTRGGTGDDVQL